ncbi:MAG: glycosyl hydrolase family 28-related protein [Prolixibacteraceae bacterium]|jgi:hypothetical protein|nr:glycosyl hydrolase family 28-related protein [Prolixibacteraceae bacterium]
MKFLLLIAMLLYCCRTVISCEFSVSPYNAAKQTGQSIYTSVPVDPNAVYFEKNKFKIAANDKDDDAIALQAAIDLVAEQSGGGIVFIPEGIYRFGKTVNLWKGIRLIGYGKTRPIFKLIDYSPYFQEGKGKYLIHFCHSKPKGNAPIQDANNNTFFSGVSNINFDLGKGNPAAVAIRFHVSQHCFIEHSNFQVGTAKGAIEEIGNLIENCTFTGGEWAIKTGNTASGWPVTILDCNFAGQRSSSIITADAGMTVIRCKFMNSPIGIQVPYSNEQLFVKDSWFEHVDKSAIDVNNYFNPETQINLENISLSHVPFIINFAITYGIIASLPEDALHYKTISPVCNVKNFSHGLHISNKKGSKILERKFVTLIDQVPVDSLGKFPGSDVPVIPKYQTWKNIVELGAVGDGITDCTQIFKQAIKEFKVIYLPMGQFLISETLELRDSTVIIGLHPAMTRFVLKNDTPGFTDSINGRSVLLTPPRGTNIITGIGFDLKLNPGAIGIKWLADSSSCINDVFFAPGKPSDRLVKLGKGQCIGLWVTDGGGGTFKNIWAPNDFAQCPFFISNTHTSGRIYEVSLEHHKDWELKLQNVKNWEFYALQTEENLGGEYANPIFIENSSQIKFANLLCYRVAAASVPYHSAIKLSYSNEIIINGMLVYSSGPFPFDNSIYDENSGMVVSHLKFTRFSYKE